MTLLEPLQTCSRSNRWIDVARPLEALMVTSTELKVTGPDATTKRFGTPVRKRWMTTSRSIPIHPSRGPEGVVEGVEEDAADQVHDEHLVPAGLDHAPALARRRRRVVGRPEHVLQTWQLADELLLGEDVVAAGDHVRAQAFELGRDLRGQAEPARGVLAVQDGELGPQVLFQPGKDRLDRFAAWVADHVGDEEDFELAVRHQMILVEKEKREPLRAPSL